MLERLEINVFATQSQLYAQVCSLQKTLEIPVKVLTKFFRTNFIAFGALQMLDWPFLCIGVKTFILSVRMPNRNPFHEDTHSLRLWRRPALKIIIQRSISQVIKIFIAWWNSINRTQLSAFVGFIIRVEAQLSKGFNLLFAWVHF